METRRLKRDVEALIGDYIGQKLREKSFDPKGTGTSTMLDQLAHYDLAISVALWWLDKDEGRDALDRDIIGATSSSGSVQYPNRLEREAMILSSFAGIILNSLPVAAILDLYRCRPAASYLNQQSKGSLVHPFTLSYHPLAMLGSYKAVHHSKKHSEKLKRWLSDRMKSEAPGQAPGHSSSSSSSSSSSQAVLSDDSEGHRDRAERHEGHREGHRDRAERHEGHREGHRDRAERYEGHYEGHREGHRDRAERHEGHREGHRDGHRDRAERHEGHREGHRDGHRDRAEHYDGSLESLHD